MLLLSGTYTIVHQFNAWLEAHSAYVLCEYAYMQQS
jgi:hypothetical protein